MQKLRWGFLGTAGIARKNWKAIRDAGNCVLAGVASRDIARAGDFIAECQADAPFETPPAAFGSYEELMASPDVDAVYIPLPTGLRKDCVLRAAQAGKHILCEKPCAVSAGELEGMLAACRDHGVQFMDGVMFMHHPRLDHIRAALDDVASVGEVRRIMSIFSFNGGDAFFQNNIRLQSALEPAGCLGDLGWYSIRFVLWAMNWQMPVEVTGRVLAAHADTQGPGSVPVEFSGELVFANGASAGFFCSFRCPDQQWNNISGTAGWLRLGDFVAPTAARQSSFVMNNEEVIVRESEESSPGSPLTQEARMFRAFAAQVRSGKLNEEWPRWALKTQQVLDACLASARSRQQSHHPVASSV